MPLADTPLTTEVVDALGREWSLPGVTLGRAVRLEGGEESAAFRIDDHVVRVGPRWRACVDLEWCHAIALAAAEHVPEALAPMRTATGRTAVLVAGRPVSVWPFVDGSRGDDADLAQRRAAADLLARLHRALADVSATPPPRRPERPAVPETDDVELDRWLADFERSHAHRQPLHGDFYAGNVLVRDGRIVALLDWDEALLGPPERELAWAAWEWGDGLASEGSDLAGAHAFVRDYVVAGGPARGLDDESLRQLVRERLRREVAYTRWAEAGGARLDDDDRGYCERQLRAFHSLRP